MKICLHLLALSLSFLHPHKNVLQLGRGRILVPEYIQQHIAPSEEQSLEVAQFHGSRPPLALSADHMHPTVVFPDGEVIWDQPASLYRTRSKLNTPSSEWGAVRPDVLAVDGTALFPIYDHSTILLAVDGTALFAIYDHSTIHLQKGEVPSCHLRKCFPDISCVVDANSFNCLADRVLYVIGEGQGTCERKNEVELVPTLIVSPVAARKLNARMHQLTKLLRSSNPT